MPNWAYSKITFKTNFAKSSDTTIAKKQLHELVEKHIKFGIDKFKQTVPYIDNDSIIPIPSEYKELSELIHKQFYETTTAEEHEAYTPRRTELEQLCLNKYGCLAQNSYCSAHWGSKWGFLDCHFYNGDICSMEALHATIDKDESFTIFATSAWSIPDLLLEKLSDLYPDVEITNEWGEEQVTEYYGRMEYTKENGWKVETPTGDDLWEMLYSLSLVDSENPEDSESFNLDKNGKISWKESGEILVK